MGFVGRHISLKFLSVLFCTTIQFTVNKITYRNTNNISIIFPIMLNTTTQTQYHYLLICNSSNSSAAFCCNYSCFITENHTYQKYDVVYVEFFLYKCIASDVLKIVVNLGGICRYFRHHRTYWKIIFCSLTASTIMFYDPIVSIITLCYITWFSPFDHVRLHFEHVNVACQDCFPVCWHLKN